MKFKYMVCSIILIFILVACSTANTNLESSPTVGIASFRVAMIFPRTIDADGWNQSGYQGLLLIESELGAEISYSEAVPEAEFEQVFRDYAEDDYDFIIGHGSQFTDAAITVAGEFPRVRFAVTTIYEGNNRNLGSLSLNISEGAYLAGVVAALKTETNHVASLSGAQNTVNEELAYAYELAVNTTNPNVEVSLVWTGSWTDEEVARSMTQELIDNNVDVIVVIAGQVAPIVHQMAEEAGVSTIGWSSDQYDIAPSSVLVSVIENTPSILLQGAILARRGEWEGQQYLFGLSENALYLSPFRGSLTAEQEAVVNDIRNAILAGELDTTP